MTERVMSAASLVVMALLLIVLMACASLCFAQDVKRLLGKVRALTIHRH